MNQSDRSPLTYEMEKMFSAFKAVLEPVDTEQCPCSEDTHTLVELAPLAAGDKAFAIWIPGHTG